MKRLMQKNAIRGKNQYGVSPIDAIFAMVIASMIAAAVTTGLGSWFTVRAQTAAQDSATQLAQGVIAKANAAKWDTLGFHPDTTGPAEGSSDAPNADCLSSEGTTGGGYRGSITVNGETEHTVTIDDIANSPVAVYPVSGANERGIDYCVRTDITWGNDSATPASASTPSNTYNQKNVRVKVSWKDKGGTLRAISVNSSRSPSVGEAIPTGFSEGSELETSPFQSFEITSAGNNGTEGEICFIGSWTPVDDTIQYTANSSEELGGTTRSEFLWEADNGVETCKLSTTDEFSKDYGYHRLTVTDDFGTKFATEVLHQLPGNKLTLSGEVLNWNSYDSTGATSYRVLVSATESFDMHHVVDITPSTTYDMTGKYTGQVWVRVETVNSTYEVPAFSNTVTLGSSEPAPTASPTPEPSPSPSP